MSINQLRELIDNIEEQHDRLFTRRIKAGCTDLRAYLQDVIILCKLMRKASLDYKNTLPTRPRKPKEEPKPEDPPKEEVKEEVKEATPPAPATPPVQKKKRRSRRAEFKPIIS